MVHVWLGLKQEDDVKISPISFKEEFASIPGRAANPPNILKSVASLGHTTPIHTLPQLRRDPTRCRKVIKQELSLTYKTSTKLFMIGDSFAIKFSFCRSDVKLN